MKKYRVRYQTVILKDASGTAVVTAEGKGQAMLAAQRQIHPEERSDEPYFHFEPLAIRPLGAPNAFEVDYKTKVATALAGEVEVAAEDPDKAVAKARFTVHRELIPPKDFRAVGVEEIGAA